MKLVIPILKFSVVVFLFGIVGWLIHPTIPFLLLFLSLGIIIQFIVGAVLDYLERREHIKYLYQQRIDEEAILAANTVVVECAGCRTQHSIPIIATERNLFRCRKCSAENVIILSTETAITTNIDVANQTDTKQDSTKHE